MSKANKEKNTSTKSTTNTDNTKNTELLSIVIPCYNSAKYVKQCLDSLKTQTDTDFEIIFVDDASTDGSGELASALLKSMEETTNIRYFIVTNKVNHNCGGARNDGVRVADGDYIMFIDVDDKLISNDAIKLIKEKTVTNPDCILLSFQTKRPNMDPQVSVLKLDKPEMAAFGPVAPWTKVIRKDLYVDMPVGTLSEDTAWHYEQCDKFYNSVTVEVPVYQYNRENKDAITESPEFFARNSITLETLAFEDVLVKAGLKDKWVSDVIRNYANMYDVRHKLTNPAAKQAWSIRFKNECANMATGHWVH